MHNAHKIIQFACRAKSNIVLALGLYSCLTLKRGNRSC